MSYVLAILITAFLAWSAIIIRVLLRNILEMPEVALDLSSLTPEEPETFDTERITLKASDQRTLSSLKITGKGIVPDKWILFLPEMAATGEAWNKYLHYLPQNGWGILALDFPGAGQSTPYPSHKVGKFLTDIELADAETALSKTIELSQGKKSVPVFGVSRGAVAALTLARKHKTVEKVIADSPFCSVEVIKTQFRRIGKIYAPSRVIELIPDFLIHNYVLLAFTLAGMTRNCHFIKLSKILPKGINCPVFFINGQKDKLAPSGSLEKLLKNSEKKWCHLKVQGAKHNAAVLKEPELYKNRVIEFLNDRVH
jgi:pimeloyl-ACP methyl ester carboxylesterase